MEEIIDKIMLENENILGKYDTRYRVNSGFTNLIYVVNDKYVIKICINENNEANFLKEITYYMFNGDNLDIPKLYKYDVTKKVVPYFYEIIQKLDGNTLYHYWYRFDEEKREEIFEQLSEILQKLHKRYEERYDYVGMLQKQLNKSLQSCMRNLIFSEYEERQIKFIINNADTYFEGAELYKVHGDLHFDNILYDNVTGKIKIIDFETITIAPIDYSLNKIFRMAIEPWKWASEETDKLTKIEDYKNIQLYIQRYFPEISNTRYLKERQLIYALQDTLSVMQKFPNDLDNKKRVLEICKYMK